MSRAKPLRILILGRGRVGGSLAIALRRAGHRVRLSAARLPPPAGSFDLVLLCVPDGAVDAVARCLAGSLSERPLVAHCAGALGLDALAPLFDRGFPVGSLHPLQAVPSRSTRLWAHAAIDAGDRRSQALLSRLAREAGLRPLLLSKADRALYHAAAVQASNGLAGLAHRAAALLRLAGAPASQALPATLSLMRSALDGLEEGGLVQGLTGPVARGDAATVRAHLAARSRRSPADLPLYRALAHALVELSAKLGRARNSELAAIAAALSSSDRGRARRRSAAPRGAPAPRHPRRARASRGPR